MKRLIFAIGLLLAAGLATASTDIGQLQSFTGATAWVNSDALTPETLRGKVVLVDFWDYTCVNCLRTLPYERAWYERYKDLGFVIVGVHTPEFKFAGEEANVRAAVERLGIHWPVALDDDNAIWNRYHNDAWPHEYLAAADGRIVYDYVGEGDYPQTETAIQRLLHELHPEAKLPPVMALLPQDSYDKPGAVCYPQTPEVFVGPWHADAALGNKEGYRRGEVTVYHDPIRNHYDGLIYLQGPWYTADQAMVHARDTSDPVDHLAMRYHAIQVVAVLKPETSKPITVYVEQDAHPLGADDAGKDVRFDHQGRSYLTVDSARAYEVVMNRHFGHHDLQLSPLQYGLGVYSFAFESCEVGADR